MNILAAILILGATGSAERRLKTEQEISGIAVRVAWGAIGDVLRSQTGRRDWMQNVSMSSPVLSIDGEPRTGWRSWAEAAWRVIAYASRETPSKLVRDRSIAATDTAEEGSQSGADGGTMRDDRSVSLAYRLQLRRYAIATSTHVSDGNIVKAIDAWWTETVRIPVPKGLRWLLGNEITRRLPIHVTFRIEATERDGKTLLVGTATGKADTSDFRCGRVRWKHAEPGAAATLNRELANALVVIEQKGTDWYHGSDEYTDLLDRIGDGMRTVGRLRR